MPFSYSSSSHETCLGNPLLLRHVLKLDAYPKEEILTPKLGRLTYADLVLFQTMDGVSFALPKAISKMKDSGKYDGVFALVERVRSRENIKNYLESDRRLKYGMGIYRKLKTTTKIACCC